MMAKQIKAGQNTSTIEGLVDYWQREVANFKRMSAQISAGSGAVRSRASSSSIPTSPTAPPAPPPRFLKSRTSSSSSSGSAGVAVWEWMDDRGAWLKYQESTAKEIDDWFVEWSEGEVYGTSVKIDADREVNVHKMVQVNVRTRKERKVRRTGGRQPDVAAEDAHDYEDVAQPDGAAVGGAAHGGVLTLADVGKRARVNGFPGLGTVRFLGE